MNPERKRPATYDSPTRRAQAARTRKRILAAAKALFLKRGIDNTSIDAVAEAADVAASTIYALFKSKAGILRGLMSDSLLGTQYQAVVDKYKSVSDPVELLKATAAIARTIYDCEKTEMGLIRGASAFSKDLRGIEKEFEDIRYALQESRARILVEHGLAPEGMSLAQVRDVIWTMTGRDVYRSLVIERGWSSDEFEAWLANALIRTLIVSQRS
jgi:AcrR family transcriptional regulator